MIPVQDSTPRRRRPVGVYALTGASGLVFLFELMLDPGGQVRFFHWFGIIPARYAHPEWAREVGLPGPVWTPFLTSLFVHGSWMHLVGNLWTLWIFGDNVEDRMGRGRFLGFYVLCGLGAGVTHVLTAPDSVVPTVGASGAISGVMGAYFVLFPRARLLAMIPVFFVPFFFQIPAVVYLVFWFVLQLSSGALALAGAGDLGGVAWWAHVGGFVTGLLLVPLFARRERPYAREQEPPVFLIRLGRRGGF